MLTYPTLNPVALSFGSLQIRWYGISYVAGILLAWACCHRLIVKGYSKISTKDLGDCIPWMTLGVVVGGRLGHVLFYGGTYYFHNPLEILMIWKPGMSFHGGFLGVIAATILFCRTRGISFWSLIDLASVGTPIGIFFGRLANFINAELWGRIVDPSFPLGMTFPGAGPSPRHPNQLYEAALEGIALFALQLLLILTSKTAQTKPGFLSGTFLIGYAIARSVTEFFREPTDGYIGPLTAGQFLCVPLLIAGIFLIARATKMEPR
jgi:phosphatidylglycerol:prolipoprotein diacylglycerol transferase